MWVSLRKWQNGSRMYAQIRTCPLVTEIANAHRGTLFMRQSWPPRISQGAPAIAEFLPPWAVSITLAVAVGIAYFAAARLGLALLTQPDGVAVFWPAAGVSAGVLVGIGAAARLPVVAGVVAATVAANLLGDRNIWSALVFALANATEAMLIALLIERYFAVPFALDQLRRVIGFVAAAVLGCTVSGIVGLWGYVFFHHSSAAPAIIWYHWFASDVIGVITVAPFVIGLSAARHDPPSLRETAEGGAALALLAGASSLFLFAPHIPWDDVAIVSIFPLLLWIAARCRPVFAATAALIIVLTIVLVTTFNIGFFADPGPQAEYRILTAQAVILSSALCALALGALCSERRRHVSMLTESAERLQDALQAGQAIAFDWNARSGHSDRSENVAQILGLDPEHASTGMSFIERIHPGDRERFKACLRALRPRSPSYAIDLRYLRPNGQQAWLEETAKAEFDRVGRIVRIRGLTLDITERKLFEEELAEARKTADKANHAKSAFLAAASHDLRQPLQTLKILHGTLERQMQTSAACKPIAQVGRALETMSDMLTSLLDINRLEAGHLHPSRSDFPVSQIFESLARDFADAVEDRGLQWRLVRSGLTIHSDRRMLKEMLRNLLSNAIRYTEHGKILMGCRRVGGNVRIEIWDSGVGIMGEHLPHIFEEYFQGPPSAQSSGFGLGLAIVQRLGNTLGHQIIVRSTPGRGSGFSIVVPLGRGDLEGDGATPLALSNSDSLLSRRMLIIEDEVSVRAALESWLRSEGLDVVSVANGNDALALITEKGMRFDLILSDFNLPGRMNGIDSIYALRAAVGWKIPAVVLTGDIRSGVIESIAKHDFSVALKPVDTDQLLGLMRTQLAVSGAQIDGSVLFN